LGNFYFPPVVPLSFFSQLAASPCYVSRTLITSVISMGRSPAAIQRRNANRLQKKRMNDAAKKAAKCRVVVEKKVCCEHTSHTRPSYRKNQHTHADSGRADTGSTHTHLKTHTHTYTHSRTHLHTQHLHTRAHTHARARTHTHATNTHQGTPASAPILRNITYERVGRRLQVEHTHTHTHTHTNRHTHTLRSGQKVCEFGQMGPAAIYNRLGKSAYAHWSDKVRNHLCVLVSVYTNSLSLYLSLSLPLSL
jgi:hypothetical protein